MQHGNNGPVKESRALGPFTHADTLPVVSREQKRLHFANFYPSALSVRSLDPYRLIAGHCQHIVVPMSIQPIAQIQIAPIDRSGDNPRDQKLVLEYPLHHLHRQFWLGLKAHRSWDACRLTSVQIFAPVDGQIQFPINEAVTTRCDVGEYVELTLVPLKDD